MEHLDVIIEGVVARLREIPPEKQLHECSGSSSAGKGEKPTELLCLDIGSPLTPGAGSTQWPHLLY